MYVYYVLCSFDFMLKLVSFPNVLVINSVVKINLKEAGWLECILGVLVNTAMYRTGYIV